MRDNRLCGVDFMGQGTYTPEGINQLCEGLKGSSVTSLECAAARSVCLLSTPIETNRPPPFPRACSLAWIKLGPKGGAALAEGLKGNSTLQSIM